MCCCKGLGGRAARTSTRHVPEYKSAPEYTSDPTEKGERITTTLHSIAIICMPVGPEQNVSTTWLDQEHSTVGYKIALGTEVRQGSQDISIR